MTGAERYRTLIFEEKGCFLFRIHRVYRKRLGGPWAIHSVSHKDANRLLNNDYVWRIGGFA
jgi:hypothetical protein